jgi:hypothetical protein
VLAHAGVQDQQGICARGAVRQNEGWSNPMDIPDLSNPLLISAAAFVLLALALLGVALWRDLRPPRPTAPPPRMRQEDQRQPGDEE